MLLDDNNCERSDKDQQAEMMQRPTSDFKKIGRVTKFDENIDRRVDRECFRWE